MNAEQESKTTAPAKDHLPPEVSKAIEEVLWYLWQDELEAFIADEPEANEGHIFRSLVAIDRWFYGHTSTVEDFIRDYEDEIEVARARVFSFRNE
jgi:hypothetical protein